VSVNKVILIGRLGQDPELRYTPSGQAACDLSLATNESWTKDGQKQERTEWHRVVVWGKSAEACKQYLSKGSQAYVEGRLQTRKWQDKEGRDRYTTEIVASEVKFLGGGPESKDRSTKPPSKRAEAVEDFVRNTFSDPGDDLPF